MDITALFKLSYGLYIITALKNERGVGCVVNTVTQVTNTPNQLMVAINKQNHTSTALQAGARFAVSVITESAPMDLIGRFGFQTSAQVDKFEGLKTVEFAGVPCPAQGVNALLACQISQVVDVGTHWLYVAEVIDAAVVSEEPSMTYAYYHQVKKGLTPPKASSYQPVEGIAAPAYQPPRSTMPWRCSVCGFIYDGEQLPEGFVCPICHQPASVFQRVHES